MHLADLGEEFLEKYRALRRADYAKNKERYLKSSKKYYEKNKDIINAYGTKYHRERNMNAPYITCDCGKYIKSSGLNIHNKTAFHKKYIKEKQEQEQQQQ